MITEIADLILDGILKPLRDWVLRLRWAARVSLFILLVAGLAGCQYRSTVSCAIRVALRDPSDIPLSNSARERVKDLMGPLVEILSTELSTLTSSVLPRAELTEDESHRFHHWSTAQVATAVLHASPFREEDVERFLLQEAGPGSASWRRHRVQVSPEHLGATGWCLFALAKMKRPVPVDYLQRLVSWQHSGGYWSIVPSCGSDEYASTYATAWAILAINQHLANELVASVEVRLHAQDAITAGRKWLLANTISQEARWKNYPRATLPTGDALSNSGLVVHTLHRVMDNVPRDLDRQWLRTLPNQLPPPTFFESANISVLEESGSRHLDATRYYVLPWLLVATKDAYPAGNFVERTRTLLWLERVLSEVNPTATAQFNWISAELVLSLRYLQDGGVL